MSEFMLKALRKKETAKKIFIFLAIVIIPAFVFWGSGSVLRSKRKGIPNYAGRIFNKKVSFPEYQASLNAAKNQAIMQFGDNFYKVKKYLNLNQQAWDRLILVHEAKKRKIKVDNQELITKIRQIGFFQKHNRFNQKLYETTINYVFRTTPRDFEEQMRDSLAIAKLYEQISQGVDVTEQQLLDAYKQEFEKVRISFLRFPQAEPDSSITAKDEEIEDYFKSHPEEFRITPMVNIEYIGFVYPQDTDEPGKIRLQENLDKILPGLKDQGAWQQLCNTHQLSIKETGFFGINDPIPDIGYSREFSFVSFSLRENQISPVVLIDTGCFVLRLKQEKDSYLPDLDEVKQKVEEIVLKNKLKTAAKLQAEKVLEDIQKALDKSPKSKFKDIAKSLKLKLEQTKEFSRNSYIPEAGNSGEFVLTAFDLEPGQISSVIEIGKNFYILSLDEVIPIDDERFVKEKGQFQERLLSLKREERFAKFFTDLKKTATLEDNIKTLEPASR